MPASKIRNPQTKTGDFATSVGLALPSNEFNVSNSPVTSSGTLTGTWQSQSQNLIFASPSGTSGTPSFRAMTAADMAAAGSNGQVQYNNSNAMGASANLTFSGSTLSIGAGSSAIGALKLFNSTNNNYINFSAGVTGANLDFTLPTAYPTTSGSALVCSATGVMSWSTGGLVVGRIAVVGTAPTVTGTGFGTGPTITVETGSTDTAIVVVITAGTTPGKTGTLTITFASTFGTNAPVAVVGLGNGTTGTPGIWDNTAYIRVASSSTTQIVFNWFNGNASLVAGSTYRFYATIIGK
jgi:hypothetical protein